MKSSIHARVSWLIVGACVVLCGCAGTKPTLQRGWVGGDFQTVKTRSWPKSTGLSIPEDRLGQRGGVLVTRVFDESPVRAAGIEAGDVILACDGHQVLDVDDLRGRLDGATPGVAMILEVLRAGSVEQKTVIVGRETFHRFGTLSLGLGLSLNLDLIPNPDFNIFGLIWYRSHPERVELGSPESKLVSWAGPGANHSPREGHGFWFLLFGLGREIRVVSQEVVASSG